MDGSNPPSERNRSARTSRQADGSTNTSLHGVVLLLVDLARLGDRVDLAEAVEAEPDVLQHARRRPTSTSLGPTMPAFERYSSSTSGPDGVGVEARRRRGRCRKNPLSPSTSRSTSLAAAPKPGLPPSSRTKASGQALDGSGLRACRAIGVGGPPASRKSEARLG